MTSGIRLATNFVLPVDAITQTFAILAKRGVGKSTTARKMAEGFAAIGAQFVAIDPVGVWYGLRSSADGKKPGLSVYIFGGAHGDLPLDDQAGTLMADVVLESGASVIFDLSDLSEAAMRRFLTDFARRLYERKARDRRPLHLILDEADEFAPQRIPPAGAALFGAIDRIVRRGRARGLGCTLISQRPAVVNKDVLTQCEVLIAMRVTHPRDRRALEEWATAHDEAGLVRAFADALPSLPIGTAYIWSPGWLDVFERVEIEMPWTFDSSYTPKADEHREDPGMRAALDLDALGARIAATREQTAAADPARLRARVAELEAAVAAGPASVSAAAVEAQSREITSLRDRLARQEMLIRQLDEEIDAKIQRDSETADWHRSMRFRIRSEIEGATSGPRTRDTPKVQRVAAGTSALAFDSKKEDVRRSSTPSETRLAKADRSILSVLAQHGVRTKQQIATLAGYAINGGGFNNALGSLRKRELIEGWDPIVITAAGREAIHGQWEALPTGAALQDYWVGRLGKAEGLALRAVCEAWPKSLSKAEVADRAGYVATGGGFNNALGKLRTLELISGTQEIRASDALFEAAR